MAIERTFVAVKPDAVRRGLIGTVIKRFEQRGLKIVGMKMIWVDEEFATKHYPKEIIPRLTEKTIKELEEIGIEINESKEVLGKRVWEDLIKFTTGGPIVAMVLEGVHAVQIVRNMVGHTSPNKAVPGTIRGDFSSISMGYATVKGLGGRNIIHASSKKESADREIKLWFKPEELHTYKRVDEREVM